MSSERDLHEERQFLLTSLRDLEREHDAGDIDDADYAALREDYTARAAAVLRAIEAGDERARPDSRRATRAVASGKPRRLSQRTITIAVVLFVVVVAGAGVGVLSGQRGAGDPATGSVPETVAGKLTRAHQLDSQGKAVEALKLYDAVLRDDPRNAEALAYRGWVLKRAGLTDQAAASLDAAITVDPRYPDAHFFRGMLLYQDRNDPAGAVREFETFLASNPPPSLVGPVRDVLERARRDAAGRPPGG